MSRRSYARAERAIISLMLLGITGMFQPFAIALYRYGFLLLLFSTILFIVISHLSPKPEAPDATDPVRLGQAVEHTQSHDR
jgi:hypothetical protein